MDCAISSSGLKPVIKGNKRSNERYTVKTIRGNPLSLKTTVWPSQPRSQRLLSGNWFCHLDTWPEQAPSLSRHGGRVGEDPGNEVVTFIRPHRTYAHDVTAAILVFQNNETAAMLVNQTNPVGVELFSFVNTFFCSNKSEWLLDTWVYMLYCPIKTT